MSITYFSFFPLFHFFSLDIRSVKASRVFHLIFGLLKPHEHSLPCPRSLLFSKSGGESHRLHRQIPNHVQRPVEFCRYPIRLFHCFKLSITTFACCAVSHRIESTFVARLMKSANACSDESRSAPIVFKSAHKQRISRACGSRSSKSAMLVV